MNRKLEIYEIVCCVFLVIAIIAGLIMPKTGPFVLADEICDMAVIWIVCIVIIARTVCYSNESSFMGKAVRGVVIFPLLAFGIWLTRDVVLDVVSGPETAEFSDLQVSQTQANTGIFSQHYYLEATDDEGERFRFEISGKVDSEIQGRDTIRIEYYRHTERIVRFW